MFFYIYTYVFIYIYVSMFKEAYDAIVGLLVETIGSFQKCCFANLEPLGNIKQQTWEVAEQYMDV